MVKSMSSGLLAISWAKFSALAPAPIAMTFIFLPTLFGSSSTVYAGSSFKIDSGGDGGTLLGRPGGGESAPASFVIVHVDGSDAMGMRRFEMGFFLEGSNFQV